WTLLFRGFQVAIDPKKLLLAAAGILLMAAGWWLLALIFYSAHKEPVWDGATSWEEFRENRDKWNLLYAAADPTPAKTTADDLAARKEEWEKINKEIADGKQEFVVDGTTFRVLEKPYGRLRTWPFFEDRGPNPYLLVSGQAGRPGAEGAAA